MPRAKTEEAERERRRKISEKLKGRKLSEETIRKISENKDRARKISEKKKGIPRPETMKRKLSETRKRLFGEGKLINPIPLGSKRPEMMGDKNPSKRKDVKEKRSNSLKKHYLNHKNKLIGHKHKIESIELMKKKAKERWQDPDFLKKFFEAVNKKPNKQEKKLNEILQKNCPNEWKYVGDGKDGIAIGCKIQDFININGKKRVIELFGRHWHDSNINPLIKLNRNEGPTIEHYKAYGFDCVVIWDNELNEQRVLEKLK